MLTPEQLSQVQRLISLAAGYVEVRQILRDMETDLVREVEALTPRIREWAGVTSDLEPPPAWRPKLIVIPGGRARAANQARRRKVISAVQL